MAVATEMMPPVKLTLVTVPPSPVELIVIAAEPLYVVPALKETPVPAVRLNRLLPSATPEMVLLVRLALAILLRVLLEPLMVLLVSVWVPVRVATVLSIEIVPVEVIGPPVRPVPVAMDVTPEPDARLVHAPLM